MSKTKTKDEIVFTRSLIEFELDKSVRQMNHNPEIKHLFAQLKELQNECPHEFVDGVCILCHKTEDAN